MSKKPPKGLGLHEPLRHPGSFATANAPRIRGPGVHDRRSHGRRAHAAGSARQSAHGPRLHAARSDIQAMRSAACGITTGAGKIPFICFDLAGGGNIAGSNVLVGGPKGQLDFLSVAGYNKLGLPGTMVPNPSATGNFIDSSFGLRFHSDSAHLRGIKTRVKNRAGQDQYHGYGDPRAVAERHQCESAQSHVRHLAVRSARRSARSDRLR